MTGANFIKAYWDNQGRVYKDSHAASWGDRYAIDLEIETISRYIKPNQRVLDAGCANGFGLFRQLEIQPNASFVGIDYAEQMIIHANKSKTENKLADGRIDFKVASILALPYESNSFDTVYTTRVLINLSNWEQQLQGIQDCLRVAKPGGTVVFSEAFWEPLCLLNGLRMMVQLPPLVEHDFNRYLKKKKLQDWLATAGLKYSVEEFSSFYYIGTRLIRDLINGGAPPEAEYDGSLNAIFHDLERTYSFNGLSIQQAYVIRK